MTDPATMHAPQTRPEFIAAAAHLRAQGLKLPGIAGTLGLSINGVRELLHAADTGCEKFPCSIPDTRRPEQTP